MNGYLTLATGEQWPLPTLLRWQINRTNGVPCDSFSVTFLFWPNYLPKLRQATRITCVHGGKTRLFGIVDEYEIKLDGEGRTATVTGRGLGGLLLDNQVGLTEYIGVRLSDILAAYVTPYGIGANYGENLWLSSFAVEYGDTAWQALYGFCGWAAGITPRFLADGTLVISGETGAERAMREDTVLEAAFTGCRYGVYSRVAAKSVATGLETTLDNPAFLALGGCAVRRVTIPRRITCKAGNSSLEQIIRRSMEQAQVLRLKVAEAFPAEPMDVVQVELAKLGIRGSFLVSEVETSLTEAGITSTLTLRTKDLEGIQ